MAKSQTNGEKNLPHMPEWKIRNPQEDLPCSEYVGGDLMKPIRLQIKKRITNQSSCGYSFESAVYINGLKLGHGVTGLNLSMPAGAKPKLTIECVPDEIDIDLPIDDLQTILKKKDRK